ncbi:hypothetical protein T484DRAFT_1977078 [Baffinella frigidus]|nr:hypothetical protein T484DRAFT_1977078 [Cryptophyta sp. CCMP2293]
MWVRRPRKPNLGLEVSAEVQALHVQYNTGVILYMLYCTYYIQPVLYCTYYLARGNTVQGSGFWVRV